MRFLGPLLHTTDGLATRTQNCAESARLVARLTNLLKRTRARTSRTELLAAHSWTT